jgi:hypothetical protein
MRRSFAWALVVLALGCGVAAWLGVEPVGTRASAASNDDPSGAVAAQASGTSSGRAIAKTADFADLAAQPLPPADAPLADIYSDLKRRADAGDARAACRVAFELLRCRTVIDEREALEARLREWESDLDRYGAPATANKAAQEQITVAERNAACRAVPRADLAAGGEYLHSAAVAGIAEAQVRYAQGLMFGLVADRTLGGKTHAYLHHPEFERWHREAPGIARDLLRKHHRAGLVLMLDAYGRDDRPFAALYADDPVAFHAYLPLVRLSSGMERMSDAQLAIADRERVAEVERQYPAGAFRDDTREDALVQAMSGPGVAIDAVDVAHCD